MKRPTRNYRYLYCAIFVFLLTPRFVNAQSAGSVLNPGSTEVSSEERSATRASSPPSTLDDRLKMLEEQVRQQNAALNEMRALIVGQQRIIDALTAKDPTSRSVDQDFGEATARHPFFISEAWVDYHPRKSIQLQAGRLQEIFADNSRFLFDDDIRFNGFNEKYTVSFKNNGLKLSSLELRAGQYILSNPNVAIVTAGSPLAQAGAILGSTGRSSNLFHQGLLINQKYNDRWSSQFGGDVQLYRNPNQIRLASTTDGVALIVQN